MHECMGVCGSFTRVLHLKLLTIHMAFYMFRLENGVGCSFDHPSLSNWIKLWSLSALLHETINIEIEILLLGMIYILVHLYRYLYIAYFKLIYNPWILFFECNISSIGQKDKKCIYINNIKISLENSNTNQNFSSSLFHFHFRNLYFIKLCTIVKKLLRNFSCSFLINSLFLYSIFWFYFWNYITYRIIKTLFLYTYIRRCINKKILFIYL